ncbi:hypothetical protein E2C01_044484 [Portunus trituberculatus]|uniref:Uncharacterized protein n=1 Tax=Portunus trituberculatus TaxID=210409 RepID=A0A5B7FZD0_PORTR|nr:hypothetical protein [Portunus trituberculatus]
MRENLSIDPSTVKVSVQMALDSGRGIACGVYGKRNSSPFIAAAGCEVREDATLTLQVAGRGSGVPTDRISK